MTSYAIQTSLLALLCSEEDTQTFTAHDEIAAEPGTLRCSFY